MNNFDDNPTIIHISPNDVANTDHFLKQNSNYLCMQIIDNHK